MSTIAAPTTIFGAPSSQPVHALVLIENSNAILKQWNYLREHTLPSILKALKTANPTCSITVSYKTTGILPHKKKVVTAQNIEEVPEIDIIDHPANKITPFFIQQSVEAFITETNRAQQTVTRHLFIVAVSNVDADNTGRQSRRGNAQSPWSAIVTRLVANGIILHIVTNPAANLRPIFTLYQNTMSSQGRQERVPWVPEDNMQCVCHLSSSKTTFAQEVSFSSKVETPGGAGDPSGSGTTFHDVLDAERVSRRYEMDGNAKTGTQRSQSADDPLEDMRHITSLVSRMQAMHGLPRKKSDAYSRPMFFRERTPSLVDHGRGEESSVPSSMHRTRSRTVSGSRTPKRTLVGTSKPKTIPSPRRQHRPLGGSPKGNASSPQVGHTSSPGPSPSSASSSSPPAWSELANWQGAVHHPAPMTASSSSGSERVAQVPVNTNPAYHPSYISTQVAAGVVPTQQRFDGTDYRDIDEASPADFRDYTFSSISQPHHGRQNVSLQGFEPANSALLTGFFPSSTPSDPFLYNAYTSSLQGALTPTPQGPDIPEQSHSGLPLADNYSAPRRDRPFASYPFPSIYDTRSPSGGRSMPRQGNGSPAMGTGMDQPFVPSTNAAGLSSASAAGGLLNNPEPPGSAGSPRYFNMNAVYNGTRPGAN